MWKDIPFDEKPATPEENGRPDWMPALWPNEASVPPVPPEDDRFRKNEPAFRLSTFYSVAYAKDATVLAVHNGNENLQSEESLLKLASSILKKGKHSGTVGSMSFLVEDKETYTLVAMLDGTIINNNQRMLVQLMLLIGFLTMAALVVISVFIARRIVRPLEENDRRLGTGFLSTPLILYVLADIDIEYAYRLLENEEIPGWLSMPKAGANTIWEAWEGPNSTSGGIGSLNHYSKGAVVEWLFSEMCGIHVGGENHFILAPKPGGSFTFAEARYNSVYGKVECGWKKTDDGYVFTVTIPSNTTATFVLPDGSQQAVLPGTHVLHCVTDRGNTVPTCDFG